MNQLKEKLKFLLELEHAERIAKLSQQRVVFIAHEGVITLSVDSMYREYFPDRMTVEDAKKQMEAYGLEDGVIISRIQALGCEPLPEK